MPNRAQTRKDPQKGKKEFSKNKGFTLIELMIVVAVLAIIMSLALPSYQTMIEKRRLTSTAQQVAAFLSSAKMAAVKRHHNVRLSTSDASAWCLGFTSYAQNAAPASECDCSITTPGSGACMVENLDNSGRELRRFDGSQFADNAKLAGISIGKGGSGAVSFDPLRGMLTVLDSGGATIEAIPLEVRLTSNHDKYALNVRVSATGRVTMCSDMDRGEYVVPGYDECIGEA